MRRCVLGLLLPLFLGCAGKNVVAGEEKTKPEQLKAEVPSWCQSTCVRVAACGQSQDCGCSGDNCDCASGVDKCPAECQAAMAAYTKGDDYCASVGQKFKSCIDGSSCSELFDKSRPACKLSAEEERACPASNSSTGASDPPTGNPAFPNGGTSSTGDAPPSSGGASSSGGSISCGGAVSDDCSSYGTAGEASGGSSSGAPVSCLSSYGSGGSSAGGSGGSSVTCDEGRDVCDDGHSYGWICAQNAMGRSACSCLVDLNVTGGFDPGGDRCPELAQVNAGCGWNITPTN